MNETRLVSAVWSIAVGLIITFGGAISGISNNGDWTRPSLVYVFVTAAVLTYIGARPS